ncbi:MAG: hypothetical protein ACK46Y_08730 [Fluviicola sp.]
MNLDSNMNTNVPDKNQRNSFLKKVFFIALALFFVGLFFQFMHWPFAGQLKVISIGQFSVLMVLHLLAARDKTKRINFLAFAIIDASFVYLGFRSLYWPGDLLVFSVLCIIAILFVAVFSKEKIKLSRFNKLAIISFAFAIYISYLKPHEIYYGMNLTESLHSYERQNVSFAWYRYAWFLYVDNKPKQAADALNKAKEIEKQAGNDLLVEKLEEKIADFKKGRWDGEYPRLEN